MKNHNLYFHPDSIFGDNLLDRLNCLFSLNYNKDTAKFKNELIYYNKGIISLMNLSHKENGFVLMNIEMMSTSQHFNSNEDINKTFPNKNNGFLGLDFSLLTHLENTSLVTNESSLNCFCEKLVNYDLLSSKNFWETRENYFPNLYFSPDIKDQILKLGESKLFTQTIEQFKILNLFIKENKQFNLADLNSKTSLSCSNESKLTLDNYGNERIFLIPDHGKTQFSLHLKLGELRIYIYPVEENKKVVVGYVGPHLKIWSEN